MNEDVSQDTAAGWVGDAVPTLLSDVSVLGCVLVAAAWAYTMVLPLFGPIPLFEVLAPLLALLSLIESVDVD
jgi:hypothetical protein